MQALNVIENPRFEGDKSTKIQVIKSNQIGVDALYLKPGQAHGPHRLPDRDRVLIVLSGKGELVLHSDPVDQRIELTPGTIALAPRGTWHAVLSTPMDNLVVALASEFPTRVEERG
jgi:quercetin dioxygenase-like cupin family protein